MKAVLSVLTLLLSVSAFAHVSDFTLKIEGAGLESVSVNTYVEFTANNCKEWKLNPVIPGIPGFRVPQRLHKVINAGRQTKKMGQSGVVEFSFKNSGKEKCDYYVSTMAVTLKTESGRSQFFIAHSSPTSTSKKPVVIDLDEYFSRVKGNSYYRNEINKSNYTITFEGKMPN